MSRLKNYKSLISESRMRERGRGGGPPVLRGRKNRYMQGSNMKGSRSVIINGIPGGTLEQCVVGTTVSIAREDIIARRSNAGQMGMGMGITIPGPGSSEDPVFNIKKGDPLFTMRSTLPLMGLNRAKVFGCLNGMKVGHLYTNTDMDEELLFLGFAAEGYDHGNAAKELIEMTCDVSTARTIVNNGTDDLFPGNIAAYMTPYYNTRGPLNHQDLSPEEKVMHQKFPNSLWVKQVSGHPNTVKVVPHLTKVTPRRIMQRDRYIFHRLLWGTEISRKSLRQDPSLRLFPCMKVMTPGAIKNGPRSQSQFDAKSLEAMAKYCNVVVPGLQFLMILLDKGIVGFHTMPELGLNGGADGDRTANFEKVAGLFGAFESKSFLTWLEEARTEDKLNVQAGCIVDLLIAYFFPLVEPGLKKLQLSKMRTLWREGQSGPGSLDPALGRGLREACINGQMVRHQQLLATFQNLVGMVTKGGGPGDPVDVDARPMFPM